MAIKVYVISERWVLIADEDRRLADSVYVKNAHVVRVWGTKSGVGQLVGGPTASTVLDYIGNTEIHKDSIIFSFPVEQAKWAEHLIKK